MHGNLSAASMVILYYKTVCSVLPRIMTFAHEYSWTIVSEYPYTYLVQTLVGFLGHMWSRTVWITTTHLASEDLRTHNHESICANRWGLDNWTGSLWRMATQNVNCIASPTCLSASITWILVIMAIKRLDVWHITGLIVEFNLERPYSHTTMDTLGTLINRVLLPTLHASVLVLSLLILSVAIFLRAQSRKNSYPPGPSTFSILCHKLHSSVDKPWIHFNQLGKKYGILPTWFLPAVS